MRQLKKLNKDEEDENFSLNDLYVELVAISLEDEGELEEDVELSLNDYIM